MQHIELNSARWLKPDDFYAALLPRLGAPDWHGRNLNALEDSIFFGDINTLEPPFHVSIAGTDRLSPSMKEFLANVRAIFADNDGKAEATISFSPPL